MQHKGITAFLTELGEGKLLGPGSAWQRSLQLQACELHAAQAEAQRCLQGWTASLRLVAQRQKETVAANAETVAAKAAGVAAAAEAERRASEKDQQHSDELKTGREDLERHEQIAAASEANMKEQLVKARRACQIKIAKVNKMEPAAVRARTRARKQVKTIMELRAECAKLHSEAPPVVLSFAQVAAEGLRQTTRLDIQPEETGGQPAAGADDSARNAPASARPDASGAGDPMQQDKELPSWSRELYTDQTPPWLLNRLRQEHLSLWTTYSSGMLKLLGWSSRQRQHKTMGGATARASAILGARYSGALHGAYDICSMMTALTSSPAGAEMLPTGMLQNKSMRKAVNATLQQPDERRYEHIAEAAFVSGANKRQIQAISQATTKPDGYKFSLTKLQRATKKLKTGIARAADVQITSPEGASCALFNVVSLGFDTMPARAAVLDHLLKSSCMLRRGMLMLANSLQTCLQHAKLHNDKWLQFAQKVQGCAPRHDVELSSEVRSLLADASEMLPKHWTDNGFQLMLSQTDALAVLQKMLTKNIAPAVPDYLLREVLRAYTPHGAGHLLLAQVDSMLCEMLVLVQLPCMVWLHEQLPAGGGVDYDSGADLEPQDVNMLRSIVNATAGAMGLQQWPPRAGGVAGDGVPHSCAEKASRSRAAAAVCARMLTSAQSTVLHLFWDGAKACQASQQLNFLECMIKVSCVQAQQPAMAKTSVKKNLFAAWMQSSQHLIPLSVAVCDETKVNVDKQFKKLHANDIRRMGTWPADSTTDLPPGLHFHITDVGLVALAAGQPFSEAWFSPHQGRETSAEGKRAPWLVVDADPIHHSDMKAWWEYGSQGGRSDAAKCRCPSCHDPDAMHLGRSHSACLTGLHVQPGETLQHVAARMDMRLWHVLLHNWGALKLDAAIDDYLKLQAGEEALVKKGRDQLDTVASQFDWWEEVQKASEAADDTEWPDGLQDRVLRDMAGVVLDPRTPGCGPMFYAAYSRGIASASAEFQATPGGFDKLWPEQPTCMLVMIGSDTAPRPNPYLQSLGLSLMTHPSCTLHCRLRFVPAFIKTLFNIASAQPTELEQIKMFTRFNALTQQAGQGTALQMTLPKKDVEGILRSGAPHPSGRACKWGVCNMVAMAAAIFEDCPLHLQAQAKRVMRLAVCMSEVLQDLDEHDWSFVRGTFWKPVDDPSKMLPANQLQCPALLSALQDSRLVSRRLLKGLKLHCGSYVKLPDGQMLAPADNTTPADIHLRRSMPSRLKEMAMLWMAVHDSKGARAGYDMYYLHELMHHMGDRWKYVTGLGFDGLGVFSNSSLEHAHQLYGKWSIWYGWASTCNSIKMITARWGQLAAARATSEPTDVQAGALPVTTSGDDVQMDIVCARTGLTLQDMRSACMGIMPLEAQLAKHFSGKLCTQCFRARHLCQLWGCHAERQVLAREDASLVTARLTRAAEELSELLGRHWASGKKARLHGRQVVLQVKKGPAALEAPDTMGPVMAAGSIPQAAPRTSVSAALPRAAPSHCQCKPCVTNRDHKNGDNTYLCVWKYKCDGVVCQEWMDDGPDARYSCHQKSNTSTDQTTALRNAEKCRRKQAVWHIHKETDAHLISWLRLMKISEGVSWLTFLTGQPPDQTVEQAIRRTRNLKTAGLPPQLMNKLKDVFKTLTDALKKPAM